MANNSNFTSNSDDLATIIADSADLTGTKHDKDIFYKQDYIGTMK